MQWSYTPVYIVKKRHDNFLRGRKAVCVADHATVRHLLPKEIYGPTKYLLVRGATVKVVITCSY